MSHSLLFKAKDKTQSGVIMDEYLLDMKGQPICLKLLKPDCQCFKCRSEKEAICNDCLTKQRQGEPCPKLQDKAGSNPGV